MEILSLPPLSVGLLTHMGPASDVNREHLDPKTSASAIGLERH
jgi:hypothetical protein